VRPASGEPAREPTFEVEGHHYAIVRVSGLPEDAATPYTVALDGTPVWPEPDSPFPPSTLRTHGERGLARIVFGSCRVAYPHEPPWSLTPDESDHGRELDALRAIALRMAEADPATWPHTVLLLGDQVYADEVSPDTLAFIQARRDTSEPPGETIADFEEYTRLYHEAWSDPPIRWLLSTVPSAMIFDDHDVIDDWNISSEWVADARATEWWDERVAGAFMSYWCYQHLGNLSPEDRVDDDCYAAVLAADGDAGPIVRDFALRADREVAGARWSYRRDVGRTRLVVMDSRAGRVLDPGSRSMVDAQEWDCIEQWAQGDFDHLLMGTSLPVFLGRGAHYLEAWNERVCDGAWGRIAARLGERLRRGLDLEHWAAFGDSLRALEHLLEKVASGATSPQGRPPGSIVLLSGDVHHAYVARARFASGEDRTPVYQAVCSPFRNALDSHERLGVQFGMSRPGRAIGRALAQAAGVDDPEIRWRVSEGPYFDNQVATVTVDGRSSSLRLERAVPGKDGGQPRLEQLFERSLA